MGVCADCVDVADRYFELLAIRSQIAIANENMGAINKILGVVQVKVKAGSVSRLDLVRELAQVEQVQANLPGLQTQERQTLYALAVLLGRPPEGFAVAGDNLDGIAAPKVGPGLPAELLLRRPDIAGAGADLAAAHANLDAARAAFFPNISLSASGGFASGAIGSYFSWPETEASLVELQAEKAQSAATRIEQYILDIEHQIGLAVEKLGAVDEG